MGPQGRQKLARWGCERAKYKGDRKVRSGRADGRGGGSSKYSLVEGGEVPDSQLDISVAQLKHENVLVVVKERVVRTGGGEREREI